MNTSSLRIVQNTNQCVQTQLLPQFPRKLQQLVAFGCKAFSLQPFRSCNSNARSANSGTTRAAAEMNCYRLLRHDKLRKLLPRAITKLVLVDSSATVAVDFSNLGDLALLAFAMQTKAGRAVPLLIRTMASNTQGFQKNRPKYQKLKTAYTKWKGIVRTDQFGFVCNSCTMLRLLCGHKPRLVFDRGFVNERLVRHLSYHQWPFVIRMREDWHVEKYGKRVRVSELPPGDHRIVWHRCYLRLVVTKPRKPNKQPWYILTNDETLSVKRLVLLYRHRFEIEETFRDLKSSWGLKRSRIRTWESLAIVVWFMTIGFILAWLVSTTSGYGNGREYGKQLYANPKCHPKKQLSWFNSWMEQLQQAANTALCSFDKTTQILATRQQC